MRWFRLYQVFVSCVLFFALALPQANAQTPAKGLAGAGKAAQQGTSVPPNPGMRDQDGHVIPAVPGREPAGEDVAPGLTEKGKADKELADQHKAPILQKPAPKVVPNQTGAGPHASTTKINRWRMTESQPPAKSKSAAQGGFPGLNDDGWIPPDVAMAAGPNEIVAASNDTVDTFDKAGTLLGSQTFASFFAAYANGALIYDPVVTYDAYLGRFWFSVSARYDTTNRSAVLIALSNTQDPALAGWVYWTLDFTLDGANPTNNWCDYPHLGYDTQAVYITCNQFSFPAPGSFQYAKIRLLAKDQFLNNTCCSWYDWWNLKEGPLNLSTSFTIQPATMRQATDADGEFLVDSQGGGGSGGALQVWHFPDPIHHPEHLDSASAGVSNYAPAPSAQQPFGVTGIDTGDARLLFANWEYTHLATGQTSSCNGNGCAAFYELDVSGFPNNISVVNDWALQASGVDYYYPSVDQNINADKTMVYSRSSPGENAGADFTTIPNSGTCTACRGDETSLAAGQSTYLQLDSNNRNRWGDYFSASPDPDGLGIWISGEFVSSLNNWATEIGDTYESRYTLTVNETGQGTVTSTDGQINCTNGGGACSANYPSGTTVTMNATAASGWTFQGWSGSCSGGNPCVLLMNGNLSPTATFTQNSYLLSVSEIGLGTVTSTDGQINCTNGGGACSATYLSGTTVTMNATAASGWTFQGWSGSCSGGNPCVVVMNGNLSPTASFTQNTYILSVSESGLGTVTSTDGQINCTNGGGACSTSYPSGTTVTMNATPASSWTFQGWSGSCTGGNPCVVVMNSNLSATATFTRSSYTLTVTESGQGTVTSSDGRINCTNGVGACSTTYPNGTSVNMNAASANGWTFQGWSGSCTGGNPCVLLMNANLSATATFTQNTYTLLVSESGQGTVTSKDGQINCISGGGTCSANYLSGTTVTMNAAPASGWTFQGWSGPCSGGNPCVLVMNSNLSATATFTQNTYTLTVIESGQGTVTSTDGKINCISGSGACSTTYPSGTMVTMNATPASGWTFQGWSGSCSGGNPCVLLMNSNLSATAFFTQNPATYTLTVNESGQGTATSTDGMINCTNGSGACGASYTAGTTVTMNAAPASGWTFQGWSGSCSGGNPCVVVMNGNLSVTATFTQSTAIYTLTVNEAGQGTVTSTDGKINCANGGGACSANYTGGTTATMNATPASGWTFQGWSGSCSGGNPCVVVMNSNLSATATFAPSGALLFVPVTPCRVVDTRNADGPFGGPGLFGNSRDFPIPSSPCGIPANAMAYAFNVTVVPSGPLGYLTIWPTGQPQPAVSTLNSPLGINKAAAAIVLAGANGSVSVYGSAATNVLLDINGYFMSGNPSALAFYPVAPCRLADTRNAAGPLGGPIMSAGQTRSFPLPTSSCNSIPANAQAYSLNFTVVPNGVPLGYLTTWPTGQSQPVTSTLNAPTGLTTANAAIVPAGSAGAIDVFTSSTTHVVIDINGYFAPTASGGLSFYGVVPCRAVDTRNANGPLGGPELFGERDFPLSTSNCGLPATAQAYSLNATVVPDSALGYLTLWPTGETQPVVSTLNSPDGSTDSNAAIVSVQNGSISAYASSGTALILDANGYFAP